MDVSLIALCAATFLVAGLVKGVVGLGLPTVSLAVLSATVGLPLALPLMVVPSAVTNLWQAMTGGRLRALLARFWPLLASSVAGVWLGFRYGFLVSPRAMTALLGAVLCVYALAGLRAGRPLLARFMRPERVATPAVGLATGALAGATGTLVLPVVPYFQALRLHRDELVQAMGISFTVSTCAIGAAVAGHGGYDLELLALSSGSLVPALVGMWLGRAVRARISEVAFRRALNVALLVIGVRLLWDGLG